MAVYGGLPDVGRRAGQRRADRLPVAVSGDLRDGHGARSPSRMGRGRSRRRRSCGSPPSSAGRTCSPASRGCCSATARRPCCRSRSSRASRRVRRVGAGRSGERGDGLRGRASGARRSDGLVAGSPRPSSMVARVIVARRRGAVGHAARSPRRTGRAQGEAIRVGLMQGNVDQARASGIRRALRRSFENYLRHDAAGDRRRRAGRAVARIVDAVLLRRRSGRSRRRCARWRARRTCRSCSAAIRSAAGIRTDSSFPTSTTTRRFSSVPTAPRPASIARCTWFRSANTCRSGRSVFFAAPLVQAVSDFSPGETASLLPVGGHLISTAICYEIVYPDLVRQFVAAGQRAADDDHQRRVVRPHLGAVSALRAGVDARDRGRPVSGARRQHRHQRHRRSVWPRAGRTRIYEPAVVVGEARFLRDSTLYARTGDVFAYASVIVSIAALVASRRGVQ